MQTQNPLLAKTLNLHPSSSSTFFNPLNLSIHPVSPSFTNLKPLRINCLNTAPQNASRRRDVRLFAGRKKSTGGTGASFVEANAHLLREAKREARRKNKKYVEGLFYRLKNPHKNYPDNFSEDELEMMGLGYDRMVQFMEKDDPNLKHPHDWYKYGEFGPYSWRGIVLGEPIRGRFSDECVTMIGEVRDQEEWEKIEQFDMARDFQTRLDEMDQDVKLRNFWVFVRHPRWRVAELPWQQWTLVCEVVMEAGDQRLDKWSLMGRLGNRSRANIAQCAAWMRPDIIYVKRPVFQCRFEPQDDFFQPLVPYLDPETEGDYMFEVVNDEGRVETCTYFGGLCRIVKVRQKAFVDDVVNAYEKMSDDRKSRCLEFLLNNHPVQLLHPYTKEWKAKLEEMELGCDAPDEDEDGGGDEGGEIVDWIEDDAKDIGDNVDDGDDDDVDDGDDDDDDDDDDDEDDDEILGIKEEEEEDVDNFDPQEEFQKALGSNEEMEKFARRSMEAKNRRHEQEAREMERNGSREEEFARSSMEDRNKRYEQHAREMEEMEEEEEEEEDEEEDGDELALRGKRAKVVVEEWKYQGYGPFRKRVQKSKAPPGKFLRAAVRPFTYRNLVKEIVLLRHAIIDGEIATKKK